MKRYYFIDKKIYFQNEKMPDRKVELFNLEIDKEGNFVTGFDELGNEYSILISELIIEER